MVGASSAGAVGLLGTAGMRDHDAAHSLGPWDEQRSYPACGRMDQDDLAWFELATFFE